MKYLNLVLLVLLPLFCTSQTTKEKKSKRIILHTSINVKGGDISYEKGRVFFSIDSITGTIFPSKVPDLYTADVFVRTLLDINTEGGGQSLELNKKALIITCGNKLSFHNWNINVADYFSGIYTDLKVIPELYNKTEDHTLTISGGNSFSLETWNTTAEVNLYEQQYSSSNCAPKDFTIYKVDAIKAEILGVVPFFTITNFNSGDVSKTLAFTSLSALTNNSKISEFKVGEIFILEFPTTKLELNGDSGVFINA